jgi:hypothetical protein
MTQFDSTTEEIDGVKFEVFKLDPMESLRAFNIVKEAVAPALGAALGSLKDLGDISALMDANTADTNVGPALEKLLLNATLERQQALIGVFKKVTHVNGKQLDGQFPLVFRGNLPLMFKWLALCFRAEWGNVGRAIADRVRTAIAQAASKQTSPTISKKDGQSTT